MHFQTPIVVNNGTTQTRTIDDFYVGTKAALAGGTTTVIQLIEQPSFQKQENNSPLLKQLENWQLWAEEKACCDTAFQLVSPRHVLQWDSVATASMNVICGATGPANVSTNSTVAASYDARGAHSAFMFSSASYCYFYQDCT